MINFVRAIGLVMIMQVLGDNIETRIHGFITPKQNFSGMEFGTSMTSFEGSRRLLIASTTRSYNSLYYCPYTFNEKTIINFTCNSFVNNANNPGMGTSLARLPGRNVVVCSNQYMFSCPNRTIEQRMIGECRTIDMETRKSYKVLTPCPTGCPQGLVADIVFLIDASGSVGRGNFDKGLNWIVQVLHQFSYDIDQHLIQSGYVLFSDIVYKTGGLRPRSFYDLKFLFEGITDYRGSSTATHKAIQKGTKLLVNSQRNVPKVMITMTDGVTYPRVFGEPKWSSDLARSKGIVMIAVGIGDNINDEELGTIANGNPSSSERVMTVESYDNLGDILDELSQVIKESASTSLEGESSNGTTELTNCQFGTSISATSDGVYIGAPGSFDRAGTVVQFPLKGFSKAVSKSHLNEANLMDLTGHTITQLKDAYLGYSTSAGKFEGGQTASWTVSGLPRHVSRGAVLIFKHVDPRYASFLLHPRKEDPGSYWQLGGYYGHTVLALDVNHDGYSDLLVSEPLYSRTAGYDEGLVFVYTNDKTANFASSWGNQGYSPMILRGSRKSGARFGMSITSAGDLDRNGYNDVIIGAPNEERDRDSGASGAVYIYYSSENGLNSNNVQRILGRSLRDDLKNFGWTVLGGVDVDGNTYPDIAVSAPSSDGVVLLKSRRLIATTLTLTVTPKVIDVLPCVASSKACADVKACLTAEYQDSPNGETFSMEHTLIADSLVATSTYRRFIFANTKTNVIKAADIPVGRTKVCNTYGLLINWQILGSVNSGGFEITPRISFVTDLTQTHKNTVMSGVLKSSSPKTVDLSFRTGCTGEICNHDLQIKATYSLPMSTESLRLDGSSRNLQVNCEISNTGPDEAFFLKVNVSSGNLTINRVNSTCVLISEDESDVSSGKTVLRYHNESSALQDTMLSGSKCEFIIDFDFTRIKSYATEKNIEITGKVYSNAGRSVAIDEDSGNDVFSYNRSLEYESKLKLHGISEEATIYFQPPPDVTVKSIATLEDEILGGNKTNFFHKYTIYNEGPLRLAPSTVEIQYPATARNGYDLLYLVDIYCETEEGQRSTKCSCDKEKMANKYSIAPNEKSLRGDFREYTITYPEPNEAISSSDKLTCQNAKCNYTRCDIEFLDKFEGITIVAVFKPWTVSFHKGFMKALVETSLKIHPSKLTALLTNDRASITSTLSAFDPDNPPPPPPAPNSLNIGALIGAIIAGLVLLAIAVVAMWKLGFFKSKYGTKTRDARRSVRESQRQEVDGVESVESEVPNPQACGSTVDLVEN